MSSNLQLFLRISALGGAAVSRTFTGMRKELKGLSNELNHFSMASKAAFAYVGFNAGGFAKEAFNANLNFHRDLLEMKQTGEMSAREMAGAKKAIMQLSGEMLQTPQEMLEGLRAFTTAGEKYEFALAAVGETARTATAFFSRPVEIANMDVDLKQKMGLGATDLKSAHNRLLYHARSGRYETKAMSMDAPRTLNTLSQVGLTGMPGVNLMGALTQRLMRLAPTTQPAEVATYMEHFMGHLSQPHYVKGLMHAGIDVKKFMPGGKFGGVDKDGKAIGGQRAVDSFLAFLDELGAKGLKDPFKMGEAGFREMYTAKAAMQSLQDVGELRRALVEGDKAAKMDLVGAAFAEIKQADFGKVKAAEIEVEKLKLNEAATQGTGGVASLMKRVTDNPKEAAMLVVGALFAGKLAYKKWQERKGGAAADMFGGAMGVQQVFVTNFPASMMSPGEAQRQKRESRNRPSGVVTGGSVSPAGKWGPRLKAGAKSGALWGGVASIGFGAYDAYQIGSNGESSDQQKKEAYTTLAGSTAGSVAGGIVGGAIGGLFGGFGAIPGSMIGSTLGGMAGGYLATPEKSVMEGYHESSAAIVESNQALANAILNRPQEINVTLNGNNLAGAVNNSNDLFARRN